MSTSNHLPPDPEGMNEKRSSWAQDALDRFMRVTGTDREDVLTDLLGDLLHWCDRNGVDFDNELRKGRSHYEAETMKEPS